MHLASLQMWSRAGALTTLPSPLLNPVQFLTMNYLDLFRRALSGCGRELEKVATHFALFGQNCARAEFLASKTTSRAYVFWRNVTVGDLARPVSYSRGGAKGSSSLVSRSNPSRGFLYFGSVCAKPLSKACSSRQKPPSIPTLGSKTLGL
jgi:hypothetical protein